MLLQLKGTPGGLNQVVRACVKFDRWIQPKYMVGEIVAYTRLGNLIK